MKKLFSSRFSMWYDWDEIMTRAGMLTAMFMGFEHKELTKRDFFMIISFMIILYGIGRLGIYLFCKIFKIPNYTDYKF